MIEENAFKNAVIIFLSNSINDLENLKEENFEKKEEFIETFLINYESIIISFGFSLNTNTIILQKYKNEFFIKTISLFLLELYKIEDSIYDSSDIVFLKSQLSKINLILDLNKNIIKVLNPDSDALKAYNIIENSSKGTIDIILSNLKNV